MSRGGFSIEIRLDAAGEAAWAGELLYSTSVRRIAGAIWILLGVRVSILTAAGKHLWTSGAERSGPPTSPPQPRPPSSPS